MRFDGTWSRADYDAVLNTEDEGIKIISHTWFDRHHYLI